MNQPALAALEVEPILRAGANGPMLQLKPGGRAGAIPLRSAQSGQVTSGLVVRPRFGWAGVGQVLAETGWHASPEFLSLPMVPGSGREIPPWVLAGPVLARLAELLASLRRGYKLKEETLTKPRGRILWNEYLRSSLSHGRWHQLPCQYPDLGLDPELRGNIRWALERIRRDLVVVGRQDNVAVLLANQALRLIELLKDVLPRSPHPARLHRLMDSARLFGEALYRGVEALGWVVEERGMGGGQEQDGLAWQLPLARLWENYAEAVIRREAALSGGVVKVGRLGETVFPLHWSDPSHRSLGHLVPDIVVRKGSEVRIVDAKYKAHLAELDEAGWRRFTEDAKESHRADIHQVLAYAALYDAKTINATLVYPLRSGTWNALVARGKDRSRADLFSGGRKVCVELRGLPFGCPSGSERSTS
ncbi:hypothetical protein HY417_00705 [Candidatus Kaiserbacteria bacterium]|nr:hypothetical protein [Candidatus Kaiserbacteria bacterium]